MVDLQMEMDMDCVAKLTEDQRIAFLKAFSRLAAADGHLDPEEKEFIRHVAVSFGVSSRRVDEILQIDNDEEIINAVKTIDNRRAALELIKEMCVLAHADDELSVLLDVLRVGFRGFAAAAGQKRQHHDNGQNPCNALFHILFFLSELASG